MSFDEYLARSRGDEWTPREKLSSDLAGRVSCCVCGELATVVWAWCHPNPNHDYGDVLVFCASHGPETGSEKTRQWHVRKSDILHLFREKAKSGLTFPLEGLIEHLLALHVMEG